MHFDCNKLFPFSLPKNLLDAIKELEDGINNGVSYVDCLQDEIRSWAHGLTYDSEEDALEYGGLTEDQAEEVITFFCRRRF